MSATQTISELWHDHAGARWLIPMMVGLAIVVFALLYMVVYPYVSA